MNTKTKDVYNLERFVTAQERDYKTALAEISAGHKSSHWIWYIFPQYAGLGFSYMSQKYAISSLSEARDYLKHEILGPRLVEITNIAKDHLKNGVDPETLFGSHIDVVKFRSSMTLFYIAAETKELKEYFLATLNHLAARLPGEKALCQDTQQLVTSSISRVAINDDDPLSRRM